jgi:hypothetical protein
MKRKLRVTLEIEYEGDGAPFGAGSSETMRHYCVEGLVILAQELRSFYQIGAARIASGVVLEAKWEGGVA